MHVPERFDCILNETGFSRLVVATVSRLKGVTPLPEESVSGRRKVKANG